MQIQWYPGHMHKASKELRALLNSIDVVIEILDARLPFSSQNPLLNQLRGDKPCIKLLNKYDLADAQITQQWQDYLEQEQCTKTLAVHYKQTDRLRLIIELCHKLAPHKTSPEKSIHVLVMGIPNVGKSTLINSLAGRTIAKTGNEPAITKMQQRIDIGQNIILFDSPGLLWHNIENRNSGYRLAVTGAIKDTAISHDEVAHFALEYLLQVYPELLQNRFQLKTLPANAQSAFHLIGRQRGCLRAGGVVDVDKVSKIILTELRAGQLGAISLETPEMMQNELLELACIRAEKSAKKQARLAEKKKRSK